MNASILVLSAASLIGTTDHLSRARKILADAARAYQTAPALRDTLSYVLEAPNAEREPKRIEIRLGRGNDVSVADGLLQAVAVGDTLYLTKTGASEKYAAGPYSGDFARALGASSGTSELTFRSAAGRDADREYRRLILRFAPLPQIRASSRGSSGTGARRNRTALGRDPARRERRRGSGAA